MEDVLTARKLHLLGIKYLTLFQKEQAWISAREVEAMQKAQGERRSRLNPLATRTPDAYRAAKQLEGDWWYQKACKARNGYQLAANMYFNAAQSAAATEQQGGIQ